MIWRYADPAMDAEAYYTETARRITANRRMWEAEHYVGDCPLCGKPMFDGDADYDEMAEKTDEFVDGYAHPGCLMRWEDEQEEAEEEAEREEARESSDEMMGDPIKALEGLTA